MVSAMRPWRLSFAVRRQTSSSVQAGLTCGAIVSSLTERWSSTISRIRRCVSSSATDGSTALGALVRTALGSGQQIGLLALLLGHLVGSEVALGDRFERGLVGSFHGS